MLQLRINWIERLIPLIPVVYEDAQEQDDELLYAYSFIGKAFINDNKYYAARNVRESIQFAIVIF